MKALVTGATGFIGSHLTELLHSKGHDVRVLVRKTSNLRWIKDVPTEQVVGSLSDTESLKRAVEGVDYIYHIAGVVASKTRDGFFRGNVSATSNLLDAVMEVNPGIKRFVHASSFAAVGPAVAEDMPVEEEREFQPITTYGESKAEAERVVNRYKDRLPVSIVRPPAVYGPRDIGVYSFFQVMAKGGFAPLIGFGRKVVSLVHVEDLVRGFVLAGEEEKAVGQTYFISSDEFYTWEQVGKVAAEALGRKRARYLRIPHAVVFGAAGLSGFFGKFQKKPPILDLEKGRDITQPFWICSVEKAKSELGYRQNMTLRDGVYQTAAWYKKEGWI